jgi:hypothetical protein
MKKEDGMKKSEINDFLLYQTLPVTIIIYRIKN